MNGSVVGGRLSDRSSKQGGGIPSVVVPPGVIQQSVVDVVESLRRAIEVGVLVFQQSQYGGNGLDLRILRSIATGIYSAQMELFDAIEALGEKKEIGMINDVSVNAANVSGETEWRFKKRKEVCQLADAIIETGKATLIEMKGLVDVDPATVVLFAAVDAGFTSFAKCRNRLNGASSLDFALFQSFGEDTVAFVQIVAEAAATLQTFPSRPEIAKAKQMLKKTGIASKNLALLLLQN
ncbi:hypothetical protein BDR26DRAFT_381289 [Obelidium mucronatum]|nr:hypothetical protein BDR26DRAFT_381289 [Obelidium mucronatum]